MEKRIERIGLSLLLVLALVSVSNAALYMELSGNSMDIGAPIVPIVITISSDDSAETTWGVYLDPISEYPTNAQLQNAAILQPAAGGSGSVTSGGNPDAGHDYASAGKGGNAPYAGDWSTVEFVGLNLGSYDVILTDGGSTGMELARASINVVPEPATIALLGLGGMFLLRRRR